MTASKTKRLTLCPWKREMTFKNGLPPFALAQVSVLKRGCE